MRSLVASLPVCALILASATPASASDCPNNPNALGVSRVLEIDTSAGPRFGTLQYKQTLDLGPKEVVLTFDDGPHYQNTKRVLAALSRECVKATFFTVGAMVQNNSEALQAIADEGHTIGAHSWSHPRNLALMSAARSVTQIERGFRAIDAAVDIKIAPFFRFPGLNDSNALNAYAAKRGYAVFSTDISSDDWLGIGPRAIVRRTMARLHRKQGGIILFHDTKGTTAAALPALLRALKRGGYKVVHIVPKNSYVEVKAANTDNEPGEESAIAALPFSAKGPGNTKAPASASP